MTNTETKWGEWQRWNHYSQPSHTVGKLVQLVTLNENVIINGGAYNFISNADSMYKNFTWKDVVMYRVELEDEVEAITLYGSTAYGIFDDFKSSNDTYKMTYTIINGEIDCATVKMEKLL
jgi:hypothetical protein